MSQADALAQRCSSGLATTLSRDIEPPPLAIEHLRAGRYREAADACREQLTETPGHAGALRMLGHSLLHLGQSGVAVLFLEQAVKARPGEPTLLVELADALAAAGSADAAAATYVRALAADPANTAASFGMLDLDRAARLEEELRAAAEADPSDPGRQFALANVLLETGQHGAARRAFDRAAELDPEYRRKHSRLGARFAMQREEERAGRMYRWGLALQPGDPELRHLAAALGGDPSEERASAAYVAQHFDGFADTFEDTLVGRLGYRGHEFVVEALRDALPAGATGLDVLDAGCGTGLCGPLLRPLAKRLLGMDLSPRMLELASTSGVYDDLLEAEIEESLLATPGEYDVIVAADVMSYFGALDSVLRASARALRPGGTIVFTVERDGGTGYVLRSSGRYAHSGAHIRAAAAQAGLTVRLLRECELRQEAGREITGLVALLRSDRG